MWTQYLKKLNIFSQTAFTRCRHILKTVKKVTAAKFELAFTRYRHNSKTVGNLTVKTRCRTFMLKKSTYTLRIDQSRSKSVEKCSVFIIVECSHDAVSNLYRLGFRFKKSTIFEIYRQKMCRFRVNGRPIRHIFHRFQNVQASCERNLNQLNRRLTLFPNGLLIKTLTSF